MKQLLLVAALFCAITSTAQNISGLYSGTLYNDTTKQTQVYQLALSEYRGKITGYAYATFIVHDTFYYSIRRVKATRQKDELVVEDVAMLVNNFPEGPNKGVHRISRIPIGHLKPEDSLSSFQGSWETTQTKKYYSLNGTMAMKKDSDSSASALVAHLTELKILRPNTAPAYSTAGRKGDETVRPTQAVSRTGGSAGRTAVTPVVNATLPYTQRQQKLAQTINITSDSMVLSFYDNGVIDGDTISVYVNKENVIARTKLTAGATRKTVYLNNIQADSIELVLVAENLGSIPPNTGLLVVQDGADKHEVRFSADLTTNASIVFRRKRK